MYRTMAKCKGLSNSQTYLCTHFLLTKCVCLRGQILWHLDYSLWLLRAGTCSPAVVELETGDMAAWKKRRWEKLAALCSLVFCFVFSFSHSRGFHPHHKGCCALHIVQAKELGHPRCQNWCCRLSRGRHACTRCSVVMLPGWQGFCLQPSWKREHWWTVVRWASSSRRFELLRICAEKSHLYYYQGMVWLRDR